MQGTKTNISEVRFHYKCGNKKAKQILKGTVKRKAKKGKYTLEDKNRVKLFYDRCEISRINPVEKSKKLEKKISYMKMTLPEAHKLFNQEYPDAQVKYGFFL